MDGLLLDRALTGAAQVRPLPEHMAALLRKVSAPPRLAAHLRAVHDAAWHLTAGIAELYPQLVFDREEVLFGAATHDIGKTIHTAELSQPGRYHEQAGYELLIESGVEHRLARFAPTTEPGPLPISASRICWSAWPTRSGRRNGYRSRRPDHLANL
ncbi:HD domain-containing protein [Allorhizocola rhizosphaerae]|uniref:HD domain-containing protein n=1 Tax=Allorhizocola rhizosphaerae TaxID=1872709 RepID=UPI001FE2619E|nr:HD domain-containing protein [Allorhizocola rhizosphaerae]